MWAVKTTVMLCCVVSDWGRSGTDFTGARNYNVIIIVAVDVADADLWQIDGKNLMCHLLLRTQICWSLMLTPYCVHYSSNSSRWDARSCVNIPRPDERSGSLHTTSSFDSCYCAASSHRSSLLLAFLPAFTQLSVLYTCATKRWGRLRVGGQGPQSMCSPLHSWRYVRLIEVSSSYTPTPPPRYTTHSAGCVSVGVYLWALSPNCEEI